MMNRPHPFRTLVASFVLPALGACCVLIAAAARAEPANLAPNADFEQASNDSPDGWAPRTWDGDGDFTYPEDGRDGGRAVGIASREGGDLSWTAQVPVEPNSLYRLSGWIRTENLEPGTGRGALLNVHELRPAATPALTGSNDWTRVETLVRTGGQETITVNCLFGGWGESTGKAWFDDIVLEPIDLTELKPEVTLHTDKTGEPINPFIYGQFIEHLGRCIYGGIWAEMLEDRKFYFPVTPDYRPYRALEDSPFPVVGASPWEILGPDDSVTMVGEDSFVGDHTPRVAAGSGIRQRDLGVVSGKEYEGYVWLRAPEQAATATVTLVWTEGDAGRQSVAIENVGPEYRKHPLRFTAGASTDEAMLEIGIEGAPVLVGTASLMPADNVDGLRADTLELLKQLGATMYRWPGGNFVSGYDWRDGIGDRDRRPPRRNPAWTGVEHNDFGMDEFLAFCRRVGAEPVITVNTGFGDHYSARQQVEYANGSTDTIGGRWRAENGNPEPYGTKYWCVGNEMWGDWQLGFMQLRHYTLKHNLVARAMWEADPELELVGSGALGRINRRFDPNEERGWTRGMLEQCADKMDYIAEHFYRGRRADDVPGHVAQMVEAVREKAEGHRKLQAELGLLPDRMMPIAMTEWNYWHHPYVYGELGCVYDLADALGIAAGLHEYFRHSDIMQMAHYAQTVNVIGCIKTTKTEAFFATTGLPLMLYRREFGSIPVELTGNHAMLGLDVAAAWTDGRAALTVAVVNPMSEPQTVALAVEGAELAGEGTVWTIAGDDPRLYNEVGEPRVQIAEEALKFDGQIDVAPYSITLVKLRKAGATCSPGRAKQ